MTDPAAARTRIDKWLWAARFFKHRSAATEAVDGGHVRLNGNPTKPAHAVRPGDILDITIGSRHHTVVIAAIAEKRGPASVAQTLYQETDDSLARAAAAREQLQFEPEPGLTRRGRPTKRDRRQIDGFRSDD